MQHHDRTLIAGCGALAARFLLVLLIGSGSGLTAAADDVLAIAKQGNFYIGGKYVESNGDRPMVGQAFVEYQIPQRQTHRYPIVLVHGGRQTGSGWVSTPDGRRAWAAYFLPPGHAGCVLRQVARGRSAHIAAACGPSRAPHAQ